MRTEHPSLPGYELVEVLGQGGFATVYRARQLAVGREVAVKVDSRLLSGARDRQRFMREVTAAGQLSGHPHVVALHDAGVLPDGRPFMVLELCPNGSLADRLRSGGPLPVVEARNVGVSIADALAAAHAAGVLHRDVKPGNIMVNRYGNVALADFGLAAMPRPGHELSATREALTPAYAPPEAFRLADPTAAGDVYSLAASVYALLSGRPPHYPEQGDISLAELIVRHGAPIPDLPGVPPALTAVLRHAMAADPAERLPDAASLRDALEAVELHTVLLAGPVPGAAGAFPAQGRAATVPVQRTGAEEAAGSATTEAGPARVRTRGRRRALLVAPLVALAVAGLGLGGYLALDGGAPDSNAGARPVGGAAPASASAGGSAAGAAGASASGAPAGSAPTTAGQSPLARAGFPVQVVTDCAAGRVAAAGAACPAAAECWGGMVTIAGSVRMNAADCTVKHYWETFAIAPLPADGMTDNQQELEKHPLVRKLCSPDTLAASLIGAARSIPVDRWTIDVLPPSETQFAQGLRVFRCVATTTGEEMTGTSFRPRN